MDEFQKLLLEEMREGRREYRDEMSKLREEFREEMHLMWQETNKTSQGLALFKGKAFGFIALLTVVANAGMAWFTKK